MNRFEDEEYHCYKDFEFCITDDDIKKLKQGKMLYSDVDEEYTVILKYYEGGKMNKEDYQEVLEKMEKPTGNEVFCDVMCRFPYELNEEQLTEVCERCPLNNTLDQIVDDIKGVNKYYLDTEKVLEIINKYKAEKALGQKQVLDKIRAEIDDLTYYWCEVNPNSVKEDVLEIIDKCKLEG